MSSLCRSLNVFPVSASVFFVSASVLLSQSLSFYVIQHLPVSVIFLCHLASSCVSHYLSMSSSIFVCQSLSFCIIQHLPVSVIIFLCHPASSCLGHYLPVSASVFLCHRPSQSCVTESVIASSSCVGVFPCQCFPMCAKILFPCVSQSHKCLPVLLVIPPSRVSVSVLLSRTSCQRLDVSSSSMNIALRPQRP